MSLQLLHSSQRCALKYIYLQKAVNRGGTDKRCYTGMTGTVDHATEKHPLGSNFRTPLVHI